MNKAIRDFLQLHAQQEPVSFHMPGHKGARIYRENGYGAFLEQIMDCDITEIPGADNLFQTEGIIAETMAKYRALYEVEQSYLLINGSSGGLIAAILTAVGKGGKLVMARNCHKSVFNTLQLGDITPIYAYPETLEAYGVLGGISADEIARCLDENPEAEAVILPSPNYYGVCSDIQAIAKVTHDRGKVLIVDQAHGAHLKFFDTYGIDGFPRAAEDLGADLVINSGRGDPVEAVLRATHGRGVDLAVEASGSPAGIAAGIKALRPGGRMAVLGATKQPSVPIPWDAALRKAVTLQFNMMSDYTHMDRALALLAAFPGDLSPLITHRHPLAEWEQCFTELRDQQGIKGLITIG